MRNTLRAYTPELTTADLTLSKGKPNKCALLWGIILLAILPLAMRGRTDQKSPILPGTAYFCQNNLLNQAGLNPAFTLMWSWAEGWNDTNSPLALVADSAAAAYVRHYFGLPGTTRGLLRSVNTGKPLKRHNVVLILMESMSAYYTAAAGNGPGLTPNLDTLAAAGISFSNFYSAGIHTFNGIFSTLYGYPALMAQHTMEGAYMPPYTGLPFFFNSRGYETTYFTTHDGQFDNVSGFLHANHMQRIISIDDYKNSAALSTLGVADHEMFDHALHLMDDCHKHNTPFFNVLMTSSNHSPYKIPSCIPFTPLHKEIRGGCVEYADWAIGRFMQAAASAEWYRNTIFVLTGDHGSYDGPHYGALPLGYSRVPCIIYAPGMEIKPAVNTSPGGQMDIFPTIAGMLGGSYTNSTMGIDLLHDSRKWAFFTQDDKIAVADTGKLYIWQKAGPEDMYRISDGAAILPASRPGADSMREYAFCMIQHAQYLRRNGLTGGK